ncbi:MAG: hypothetical protein IID45_06855 [Planctomycetes bacterium]|nr:hypothetical protein [Planctomycetota bacterium]
MSSEPNEQPTETRAEETAAPLEPASAKARKTRSPIERIIVWVAILLLAGFAGVEGFASYGYTRTLAALDADDDVKKGSEKKTAKKLSDVINGYPSQETEGKGERIITYRWFSFIRTYEIQIHVADDKDDPVILRHSLPDIGKLTLRASGQSGDEGEGDESPNGVGPGGPGGPGGARRRPESEDGGGQAGSGNRGGGGRGRGRGGRGRRGPRGVLGQLAREDIQTTMKLTDEQKSKIQKLAESSRLSRADFEGKSAEERTQMRADSRKKIITALKEILDDKQFVRAKQLGLQSDGPAALVRDDVQSALKLTDEQKKKIKDIQTTQSEAFAKLRSERRFSEFQELRQKHSEELLNVLTEKQKEAWKKLLGPPAPAVPTPSRKRPT